MFEMRKVHVDRCKGALTLLVHMMTQYITKMVTCCRVILTHYSTCGDTLQGNNILSGLGEEEYARVVDMLEKAILSTDLALYFQ